MQEIIDLPRFIATWNNQEPTELIKKKNALEHEIETLKDDYLCKFISRPAFYAQYEPKALYLSQVQRILKIAIYNERDS